MRAGSKGTIQTLFLYFPLYTSATLPTWKTTNLAVSALFQKNFLLTHRDKEEEKKERKNGRPKFFSPLHVSVSTRWSESAKMSSNISTCFVLCTVSNRKQENTLKAHLISLTTPEICVQAPDWTGIVFLASCFLGLLHETAQPQQRIWRGVARISRVIPGQLCGVIL
jgi:hypothetical protein